MLQSCIMTLKEIYAGNNGNNKSFSDKPIISFEIFPPKNDDDGLKLEKLLEHLNRLKKYNPAYVSLTYGAGGTNQDVSLEILKKIHSKLDINVMPHFTCVNSTREHVESYLNEIQSLGVKKILALRGDIPADVKQENFDFHYANELVDFIKSKTSLSIGVAGYPEGHMECDDMQFDMDNLKKKVDAGADAIFTQMFFDTDKFLEFVDSVRNMDMDMDIPIIPGILPIRSYQQLEKMLTMAKVTVPSSLMQKLEKYKDNPEDIKKIGVDFATQQCLKLMEHKCAGLHFYTLNTSSSVSQILDNIL